MRIRRNDLERFPARELSLSVEPGERQDQTSRPYDPPTLTVYGPIADVTATGAGKGHETGQEVRGVVHPFDDREVVRELLATFPRA